MAFGALRGTLTGASTNPGTGINAAGSVAISVGDLILVNIARLSHSTSAPSVTDNLGNTYAIIGNTSTTDSFTGNPVILPAYSIVASAGTLTSVSFTSGTTTNDLAIAVAVYEGAFNGSAPLDVDTFSEADATSSSTACPASGTLAQSDELVIGMQAQTTGATAGSYGSTGSFALDVSASSGTGSSTISCGICSLVVSSTTSQSPVITTGSNQYGWGKTLSFRKSGGSVTKGSRIASMAATANASTSSSVSVSSCVDVSVGDVIVIVVSENNATEASFSSFADNIGNTYSARSASYSTPDSYQVFTSIVSVAGRLSDVTGTRATSSGSFTIVGTVFRGPYSAVDKDIAVVSDTTSPHTGPATGTLNLADELVVYPLGSYAGSASHAFVPSSPMKNAICFLRTNNTTLASIGYNVVSSTSSVQYTFTNSGTLDSVLIGAITFKYAASGRSFGIIFG